MTGDATMDLSGEASDWLRPTGLPPQVRAVMTTRQGGVSAAPFDSMNLRPAGLCADACDDPAAVAANQARLASWLGARPIWLDQVHGAEVVTVDAQAANHPSRVHYPRADASVSSDPQVACAVLVADCLPVLMASPDGRVVAAAHAGWRGLGLGVLEATLRRLVQVASCEPAAVATWLGACIGPAEFEVGADVLAAFGVKPTEGPRLAGSPDGDGGAALDAGGGSRTSCAGYFRFAPRPDGQARWRADLAGLAAQRLRDAGVSQISGGQWCTVRDASRFFSYRRDRLTGRMAACIRPGG